MIKTFTQDDLIRFLYHETSEKETTEINKALLADADLRAQFNELSAAIKSADNALMQPSSTTVLNILAYSRGLQEKHT